MSGVEQRYAYAPPTVSVWFEWWWRPAYQYLTPRLFGRWAHPNVLTMLGLLCNGGSFVLLAWASAWFSMPTSAVGMHVWVGAALLYLGYAVCDNCDGIQARRLGLSSPIGEFLDHGVDSLDVQATFAFWALFVFHWSFFATHAISVVDGSLLLGFRWLSVDELFFTYSALLVCEGLWPQWLQTLSVTVWDGVTVGLGQALYAVMILAPAVGATVKAIVLVARHRRVVAIIVPVAAALCLEAYAARDTPLGFAVNAVGHMLGALSIVALRMEMDSPVVPWWLPAVAIALVQHWAVVVVVAVAWPYMCIAGMQRKYGIQRVWTVE